MKKGITESSSLQITEADFTGDSCCNAEYHLLEVRVLTLIINQNSSVIDVEFYYSRFGELITPRRLYPTVTHPAGVFAPCHFNQTSAQPIMMNFSYFTRSLILFLTRKNSLFYRVMIGSMQHVANLVVYRARETTSCGETPSPGKIVTASWTTHNESYD